MSSSKFVVPSMAIRVVDRAIQSFGAEGVSQDTPLARAIAGLRTLRLADVSFFNEWDFVLILLTLYSRVLMLQVVLHILWFNSDLSHRCTFSRSV